MATRSIVPRNHKEGSLGKSGRMWGNAYIDVINANSIVTGSLVGDDGSEYVTKSQVSSSMVTTITDGFRQSNSDISTALADAFVTNITLKNMLSQAIVGNDAISNLSDTYVTIENVASKGNKNTPVYFDDNGVAQTVDMFRWGDASEGTPVTVAVLIGTKDDTEGYSMEIPWIHVNEAGKVVSYGIRTHVISPEADGTITSTEGDTHVVSNGFAGTTQNTEGYEIDIPWIQIDENGGVVALGTHKHTIPHTTETE